MVNYPTSLDALANPTSATFMDDTGFQGDVVISTLNDIAEQLEVKLGVGAANQNPAAAGMVGRVLLTKLDGTTEWLIPFLFNSLRNGGMERWSLGTSIAVAASISTLAGMGPDCWVLKTNANQASHWIQTAGLTSSSQWAAVVGRDSGQTGTGVMVAEHAYTLEEIVRFRGQKVALSLALQANANWSPTSGNITVRVACGTGAAARRGGSAYTSETTLISQTFAITTSPSLPAYVSSVVVPTNATQMSIGFEWTPTGTAGAADSVIIDDVMLVPGDVPMPFKTRVDDGFECARHLLVLGTAATSFGMFCLGVCESTTTFDGVLHFPAMRVAPTLIVISGNTDFAVGQSAFATTAMSSGNAEKESCRIAATVASGLTAGQAAYLLRNNAAAARITLHAGV